MTLAHREEVAKLSMEVALYRATLEEHGIEPPNRSGDELLKMWRDCMAIVRHASEFSYSLGSAKELLEVWS